MRTIKVRGGFFLLISGKHLSTLHERGTELVGGMERGREGGDDLEMGMGWGKEEVRERRGEVGEAEAEGGVSAPQFQQFDRCSTLSSTFPPSAA